MRLIDADKLYSDCMTKNGTLAISQSQIANAPIISKGECCGSCYLCDVSDCGTENED